MSKSTSEELVGLAYTALGFGIIGLQRAMVLRYELEKQASKRLNEIATMTGRLVGWHQE